jgi:hypothetical protein
MTFEMVLRTFDENSHSEKKLHLKGKLTVSNRDLDNLDKERHGNLSFLAFKDFKCCEKNEDTKAACSSKKGKSEKPLITEPLDLYSKESIRLVSEEFCEALSAITKMPGRVSACYPDFETSATLDAPYPWYYIDRHAWRESAMTLTKEHQKQIDLFVSYADENLGKEYKKIDSLLNSGLISIPYLDCLFVSL